MAFNFIRYASEGRVKKLKKCINHGIHIDAADTRKETALFRSCLNGKVKCVEYLLINGANPNRSNIFGMTPIHAAIQNVHIKCVGILLQYGSDLHCSYAECPTILAFARYHGNQAILRLIEAFMDDNGMGHHQPAQNYNAIIMDTCASSLHVQLPETKIPDGIPIILVEDLRKPDHNNSFNGPCFTYVDGMWRGSLVTVKYAPGRSDDEFYRLRLRKEINLLRQFRHVRFPVALATCLDPFCLILERFYFSSLSHYLRDENMEMEKDKEFHLSRVVRIMLDVAQALSYLHQKKWIHCHVTSQSIFVSDGPRAKLGSLEFCQRPGEAVERTECFKDDSPWFAPEVLEGRETDFPNDIYSLAATFWECLTRHIPWSWLPDTKIPSSRRLPVLHAWPSLLRALLSHCFEEAEHRPSADEVCVKLEEFSRLDLQLDRYQLDEIAKEWFADESRAKEDTSKRRKTSRSSSDSRGTLTSLALGEKYSSLLSGSTDRSETSQSFRERRDCRYRRRSAVVTTLVEEALTTMVHIGLPPTEIHEADIYKFGLQVARNIAQLRGFCSLAKKTKRKRWAKVAMATRDLDEDMYDTLAGYEQVTFRRKHAHAANLKKQHQERTEERLKDTLQRTRYLIKRHKRKNWACYTMLLCELYGILRRTDTIEDEGNENYEQEAMNQSIINMGSQMRKLSSIIFRSVPEDSGSTGFNSNLDLTFLTRLNDVNSREDLDECELSASGINAKQLISSRSKRDRQYLAESS